MLPVAATADVDVDRTAYNPDCGVKIGVRPAQGGAEINVEWPLGEGADESGRLVLDLRPGKPLFASLAIVPDGASGPGSACRRRPCWRGSIR